MPLHSRKCSDFVTRIKKTILSNLSPHQIFTVGKHYYTTRLRSEYLVSDHPLVVFAGIAAKDNSTATTDSRALQATNGGGVSSPASATAGAALTVLLAGYLLVLVPELSPSSF